MTVGANIRIAAAPVDPAATPPELASLEELFGKIIASLGEPVGEPAAGDTAAEAEHPVLPETQSETFASADRDISSIVEQLLALVARQPHSAVPGEKTGEDDTADAEPETDSGKITADDAPAAPVALPALLSLVLPAEPKIASEASPSTEAAIAPETPKAPAAAAAVQLPELDSPEADLKPAQIAPGRADAAVQQAFSSLEATIKDLSVATWAAAFQQSKESAELDRAVPHQDPKLAASSPLPGLIATLAPDPVRPNDTNQAVGAASPQPRTADILIDRQLDMAHEGEWLDRLAKDIAQTAGTDKNPLRFRLNPETLGTLRVEISQEPHGAAVRLTADTEAARSIIADAQPRLIAEARAQGIRISEAHVDLGNNGASGDPRRQNAAFEDVPIRTARSLQDDPQGDGKPTPRRSERYA